MELLGTLPLLLLAGVFALQLLLVGFTVTAAENAARTGSRAIAGGRDGGRAAVSALPGYLRDGARPEVAGSRVTLRVEVPLLFPGLSTSRLTIARSAELPRG